MKETVSIKVKIADRIFPIRVTLEEEVYIRKAAKLVEDKILDLRSRYGIVDTKDALAMIALELATESAKKESKTLIEDNGITDKINHISELLKAYTSN